MTDKPSTPTDIIAARIDSRRLAHAVVADLESHGFEIRGPVIHYPTQNERGDWTVGADAFVTFRPWVKAVSPYASPEPSDAEKDGGGDGKPSRDLPAMYGLMEDDGARG